MSPTFIPPPPAWYALRRTLPLHTFAQNLAELVAVLPRYRVDELIVKLDSEELSHGQVPLAWAEAYARRLREVREALREIGVAYSLNPWITIGHTDRGRQGALVIPDFEPMVGHDGVVSTSCACPLSPAWRKHTETLWTLYAETEPRVMWVEDDIRNFNHLPVRFGCFCERHLQRITARIGRSASRAEVVDAVLAPGEPHPWRDVVLRVQAEITEETSAFLAKVVHRVSPKTSLGLMSSGPRQHALEGRDWHKLAAALADSGTLYSRPPLANYWEESLRGLYYSHDSIKATRHCLPKGTVEQTEVENIPFTRFSKSTTLTYLQMALSFAYGCRGVTLNLFDHVGTAMESDAAFGRMLGERKEQLNALAEVASQPGTYRGVQLVFTERNSAFQHLRPGADYGELAAHGEPAMTLLEAHGIPTTYSPETVAVAMGEQLRGWSDEAIRGLAGEGRGLLLDAQAASTLVERGLGDLIGVAGMMPPILADDLPEAPLVVEELHDPEFGGAEHRYLTLTLPSLMGRPAMARLTPEPAARVTSFALDPERRRRLPASLAYVNRLGGRVWVHALDWRSSYGIAFNHPFRASQLQAATAWLAREAMPVRIIGDGVYPLGFRKDLSDETLLGCFNLSLDPWTKVTWEIADSRRPAGLKLLGGGGRWYDSPALADYSSGPSRWQITFNGELAFHTPVFVRVRWQN